MHDIKIGTLISADKVESVMPKLISYGFETFSITFWKTLGGCDLVKLADSVKRILADTD